MITHDRFDAISTSDLANITGGGKLGKAQKLYKWWTGSKKAGTPKELYTEGRDLTGDALKFGAGTVGGYQALRYLNKGDPSPSTSGNPPNP